MRACGLTKTATVGGDIENGLKHAGALAVRKLPCIQIII